MKRILLGLFAVFMSLGLACGSVFIIDSSIKTPTENVNTEIDEGEDKEISANTNGYWDDNIGVNWIGEVRNGILYYYVDNAQQLARLAYYVNNNNYYEYNGTRYYLRDAYVELRRDIDLSAHYWIPIGNSYDRSFTGNFDGNGYTISGIYIDSYGLSEICSTYNDGTSTFTEPSSNDQYIDQIAIGLFGYANGAIIGDFNITGSRYSLEFQENSLLSLTVNVGSVVGLLMGGQVAEVESDCDIYIEDSTNTNVATSNYVPTWAIGGIVGKALSNNDISYCFHSGQIELRSPHMFTGMVSVGGIVGYTTNQVSHCSATSSFYTTSHAEVSNIGGIVGLLCISANAVVSIRDNVFNGNFPSGGSFPEGWTISSNGAGTLGGIVGCITTTGDIMDRGYRVNVHECVNYADLSCVGAATSVGGIVGSSYGYSTTDSNSLDVRIFSCANFGNLNIVKCYEGYLYTYPSFSVKRGIGGIIGVSGGGIYVYDTANYGNITCSADGSNTYWNVGGIIGAIARYGFITACINHGRIQANGGQGVGGIVGVSQIIGSSTFESYITNCINYSGVTASQNYGQIVGNRKYRGCTTAYCFYNNKNKGYSGSYSNLVGGYTYINGASRTYSYLRTDVFDYCNDTTSVTFQENDYSPTYSYSSKTFSYSTEYNDRSYSWLMSPLVYYYYSSAERNSRDLTGVNIMVPMAAAEDARVLLQWNKREGDYTTSYSSDIAEISYLSYDEDLNMCVWKSIDSQYQYFPYLKGANYTVGGRAEYLFKVEYVDKHWESPSVAIYHPYSSTISSWPNFEINRDRNSGINTISNVVFMEFANYYYGTSTSQLTFRVQLSSIPQEIVVESYILETYNGYRAEKSDDGGNSEIIYEVEDMAWYHDSVQISAVPNLGYAVKQISMIRESAVDETDEIFYQTVSGSEATSYGSTGSQGDEYIYDFFDGFDVYYVPIVYNYQVIYDWEGAPPPRYDVISMLDRSSNSTIRKSLAFDFDDATVKDASTYYDLEYGYAYDFYLVEEEGDPLTSDKLIKTFDSLTSSAPVELTSEELLEGLDKLTDPINKTEFTVYVVRRWNSPPPIFYIYNVINNYEDTDYYNIVELDNFQSLIFGDLSANEYYQLYGSNMPSYEDDYLAYLINTETGTVNPDDRYVVYYDDMVQSFVLEGFTFIYTPQLVQSNLFQIQGMTVLDLIKTYREYIDFGGDYMVIYAYSTLQTYDFSGDANMNIGATLRATSKENTSTTLNFSNVNKVHYFAPVTVSVSYVPIGYDFVGWYANNNLLSLDESYTFINDRMVGGSDSLTVTARFVSYDTVSSSYSANSSRQVYSISSAQDLIWLSQQVASGNTFDGVTFNQTVDINMSGIIFNPIGSPETPFRGIYNGKNYIIKNLNLNTYSYNLSYRGLFGYVDGATIKNLTLKGEIYASYVIKGYSYLGSFVGYAKNSTFVNLNNYNYDIEAQDINYSSSSKPVVIDFFYDIYGNQALKHLTSDVSLEEYDARMGHGGLIGYAENCSLFACSSQSYVRGVEYVGGLVGGSLNSSIEQSYAIGSVNACRVEYDQESSGVFARDENGNFVLSSNSYYFSLLDGSNGTHILRSWGLSRNSWTDGIRSDLIGTIVAGDDSGTSVVDCFWSQTGHNTELVGDISYSTGTILDPDVWVTVNGKTRLKVFYWA